MIDDLTALMLQAESLLFAGFLIVLRLGAVVSLLPGFGERMVPMRIRLALTLALTLLVLPVVAEPSREVPALVGLIFLMASEIVIGLVLGLSIRLIAHGLLLAGAIAAQATSLAQLFGGAMADGPQPSIGMVLYWSGLAIFMLSGMPVLLVEAFVGTYQVAPVGHGLAPDWSATWIVDAVAATFALGFSLAAPFVISAVLYNVAMGVINKAMPQLMVAFVGAPALTAAGMILLLLCAPVMLQVWLGIVHDRGLSPFGAVP